MAGDLGFSGHPRGSWEVFSFLAKASVTAGRVRMHFPN